MKKELLLRIMDTLYFVVLGSLTNLEKYGMTTIDSDSYVVTAGAEGAIITVFHDSTDD